MRSIEIIQIETQREKENNSKIHDLWNNTKCSNLGVIEIPKGEGKFKTIITENFPKLMTDNIAYMKKLREDQAGTSKQIS